MRQLARLLFFFLCTCVLAPLAAQVTADSCDFDFAEVDGRIIIEAEDLDVAGTEWAIEAVEPGFSGTGHLTWEGGDFFNGTNAGLHGVVEARIRITTPGKYRFQWRSAATGGSTTDRNDSWVKFPDADDFYGEKANGERTYPRGETRGRTPNPEGASGNGWFKVYVNNLAWAFTTSTGDNADGRPIFAEFDEAGVYTFQLSGRSEGHQIDRIVIYRVGAANPLDLNLPPTNCDDGSTPDTVRVNGVDLSPGAAVRAPGQNVRLVASYTPANVTVRTLNWASSDATIASVDQTGLVEALAPGQVTITATSPDGPAGTATITVTDPATDGIRLGNPTGSTATADGWNSNLVINETDTYTNTTDEPQTLTVTDFTFYADRRADPVTPFLVRVLGDDDFTVLAVGTTRTQADYAPGENVLPFVADGTADITLQPGETIASGFLDAADNGSGGGAGSVIPYDDQGAADEIWYSGGPNGSESARVAVGAAPTAGGRVITTLMRTYRFALLLELAGTTSAEGRVVVGRRARVFPNPAGRQGEITVAVPEGSSPSLSVIDPMGRVVFERPRLVGRETVLGAAVFGVGGLYLLRLGYGDGRREVVRLVVR